MAAARCSDWSSWANAETLELKFARVEKRFGLGTHRESRIVERLWRVGLELAKQFMRN
jgi:hypothetical protein